MEGLTRTDETKIRKGGRDIIKADFVFASFYGSTARSCAKKTDVPEEVMVPLSGEFWRVYKGVKKWQDIQRNTYKSEASIYTITGRERHGPLEGGNEVINNPIQGSAADIVADAMNELAALSREMDDPYFHPTHAKSTMTSTFILKDDNYLEDYLMEIFRVMVKVRYPWQIVPFAVEASIGEKLGGYDALAHACWRLRQMTDQLDTAYVTDEECSFGELRKRLTDARKRIKLMDEDLLYERSKVRRLERRVEELTRS